MSERHPRDVCRPHLVLTYKAGVTPSQADHALNEAVRWLRQSPYVDKVDIAWPDGRWP